MLLKPPSYLERGCVFKCQLAAVATIARGLDAYGDEDPVIIYGRVQRKAVSLLTSSIRPPTQVARELGVQPPLLHHWRDDRQANGTVTGSVGSLSSGDVSAEHAESRRMEKERHGLRSNVVGWRWTSASTRNSPSTFARLRRE